MALLPLLLTLDPVWARTAPAAGAYAQGLLFRIDAPGRPSSWVLGTRHSSDPRVVAVAAPVRAALEQSRAFAPAMPLTPRDLPGFATAAQFADEHRLADYFNAETIARIRAALGDRTPPPDVFVRLKPWAVLLLLVDQAVQRDVPTLTDALMQGARRRGMQVIGLELAEEQVASLDTIPVASQVALVHYRLGRLARLPTDNDAEVDAWLARDLKALTALAAAPGRAQPALAPHVDAMHLHLVENRSVQIAHRLYLPLREGRVFVAVDAVHLYGRNGLLALIHAQGYSVKRIW